MAFVPGTNYYTAVVGNADSVIGNIGSGDVCILEPGTHVITENISPGVTVRGRPGRRDDTIIQCAAVNFGPWATVRGVTIEQTGGDAAFVAGSGGAGMRWVEDCALATNTSAIFEAGESWTFARCIFAGGNQVHVDGAVELHVVGCLFLGTQGTAVRVADGDTLYAYNNTFVCAATSATEIVRGGASTGISQIYNNVFNVTGADTAVITNVGGAGTIYGNWSTYDLGNASWGTVVSDLRLRADGYPTNESPVRIAATPQSGDAALDLRYLPFASARSAGCYQWVEDTTALYRRRVVDPLDGFVLDYDSKTLDVAPGRQTFGSHLELAAYVRAYVNDLVHPYYGAFYTSATGAYRLRTWFGDPFDLTISGESASVFGAANLSAVDDTG